jgi:hypothetical protein
MDFQWTETETTHNVLSAQSVGHLSDFRWTSDGLKGYAPAIAGIWGREGGGGR